MDKPSDQVYIEDILEAIGLVEQFIAGKTFEDFKNDPMLNSAVTRQIEIIGEASKRLSKELKESLSQLHWHGITGMRDFLIHQYMDVDLAIVWKAATEDTKLLKQALK
jgi:uncharacterized protein with HEPN domain